MKRLITAPNLALATLWADWLTHAGVATTVQRQYASSIAGELPPDQTLPELWVQDDGDWGRAGQLLHLLRHPTHRRWSCPGCREQIDGPFEQCWNCGTGMPVVQSLSGTAIRRAGAAARRPGLERIGARPLRAARVPWCLLPGRPATSPPATGQQPA